MNLDQMLAAVTPEVYENLKYAVETGKWQNGQKLTEKQREVYLFMYNFIDKNKYPPAIKNISEEFNISIHGAYCHMKVIEYKGYISKKKKKHRSIKCNVRIPGDYEKKM